jgi:molybdopterin synthase catalytic subunit
LSPLALGLKEDSAMILAMMPHAAAAFKDISFVKYLKQAAAFW